MIVGCLNKRGRTLETIIDRANQTAEFLHGQNRDREAISEMSCQIKVSSKDSGPTKAPRSQTPPEPKTRMRRLFGRSQHQQGDTDSKTPSTNVATGSRVRRREGQSKGKARFGAWNSQPAGASTARAGAPSMPIGRPNTDKNIYPSPSALAGSERPSRRATRAIGCSPCGDSKYFPPHWKTLGEQRQKSSGTRPEQLVAEVKIKEENTVTETSQKIVVRINQYPKVTLCDIAQTFDAFCHDCGYVLPDVLKTKVVHCFKRDMRAGFQFESGCLGHNNHESEDGGLAKNRELFPRVQSEKSVCQSQHLTEHQRHLKGRTDAQMLSGRTAGCFLGNWTSESSAPRSAPFVRGKKAKTDRAVREDPGPRHYLTGVEISREKRMRLGDSVKGETLPSTPDVESISCKNPAKTDCREKEKTCVRASDDRHPCSEHAAGSSSTLSSAVKENGVNNKSCGEIDGPTRTNAAQMSSELLCETNDELESFTCQRVRVYFRKNHFSCARTYMTWPFSDGGWTLATHAATTSCPAEAVNPLDNSDSPLNQNQQGSPSNLTSDTPGDPSSDKTHQVSHQNDRKREEDGERILAERSGKKRRGNMSLYSSESTDMEFAHHLMDTAESPARPPSDTAGLSSLSQRRRVSDSYLPINGPQTDSSMSTLSPSAIGLSDWETTTTLSSMSSPFTHGGLSSFSATPSPLLPSSFLLRKVKSVELADASSLGCVVTAAEKTLYCEDTQMTSCSSSSSAAPHNSDSFESCESSLLLPQDERESDEEFLPDSCPPKLEPYYNTSPINHGHVTDGSCAEYEFMFVPVLSPVTSPKGCSQTSVLPQSPGCSDEEEEEAEINKGTCKHKMLPGCHMPQIVKGINENSKDYLERGIEEAEGVSTNFKPPTALWEPQSCPCSDEDAADDNEEESQDETDCEYDIEQGNTKSERVPSDPKVKSTLTSGVLTEPCSSPSSDEDDGGALSDEGPSPSEITGSERDQTEKEDACNTQQDILDEFTAYEQDILLVDVIQDDPELFENPTQQSLLKLGPSRATGATKARPIGGVKTLLPRIDGASLELKQGLSPVIVDFHCNSPDSTEESNKRPWRPQYSSTLPKMQSNAWPATEKPTEDMDQSDANNNHVSEGLERNQTVETVPSPNNPIPPLMTVKNGPWITNQANFVDLRRHKCTTYCRQYFSESLSCGFKMCRFQHVPVEGDEQFCVETVMRFTKNPMCLQKAGAVFTSYYHKNPPGAYFSMTMFLSLLWALLKAGMVSDVFSVLSVSLDHKIVPGHEFVLALFNLVREKALMGFVPELMQLTFKMASAGLVLSLDCLDCVKNTPEVQQTVHPNSLVSASGSHKLSTGAAFPEYLNLAHAIVEIELCAKQEHWRRMGEVFRSICQSSQHPNQVEQISGRIAVALLSEGKDKLSLPFASFAETACQNEDNLIKSFLGRIGVSLMLRYHKTHQWAKGRRVVEVLSISKISYSTLKGLFGNENGASRCCLVTVAAELFLLSGSVEGALNTLRANEWFLSSSSWPCEPADVESRIRVLIRLAEKTCHRDTLYVLRNLPGIKEPIDLISVSRYHHLFNSHLQVFMDRQALLVASDTVDFMLSNNLAVKQAVLQILFKKLGKQNLWLRAREVFRHSLSVGCYPAVSAPPGLMTLMVPCQLGEVELALAFEMFITVNATAICHLAGMTTHCLSITLKRAQSCESEYLSAGSRLLSAACIPQPKLIVHYTAVNSSQEQVFRLDISSARCWLRHNHLWANEVWTH